MNRHRYYESPTIAYNFRTTFKAGSDYNILIISLDAQTCMARYVVCSTKYDLLHTTLAIAWSRYFSKVEIPTMKPAVGNPTSPTKFIPEMKQNFKKAGRHPKIDPTVFRCSVNFNATGHIALQTMHEKSGVDSLSAFIKMQLFGKPFKVFSIDTNTRIFIDRLSSVNHDYRTLVVDYDTLVRTLRENFTEKKAMSALYRLEQITIELVKTNREIVAIANSFDAYWRRDSND